jgi:hypothetical protein
MKRADAAEVSGGYYEAELSASGNTYYMRKKDGKWVCEKNVMRWISKTREPNKPDRADRRQPFCSRERGGEAGLVYHSAAAAHLE